MCKNYLEIKIISFFSNTPILHPTTAFSTSDSILPQARFDTSKLQGVLQRYYLNGMAPTTRNSNTTGKRKAIYFCSCANRTIVPISESTLLLFLAHLTIMNLSYATIKVLLSAIRHTYVCHCRAALQFYSEILIICL